MSTRNKSLAAEEAKQRRRVTMRVLWEEYERVFGEPPPMICMDDPYNQMREALRTGVKFNPMPGADGLPDDALI